MKTLNYKTLEETGYQGYVLKTAPEKVLQFGAGNFLRAFADYYIDLANEWAGFNGKVVLVQPIPTGPKAAVTDQEGLYTVYLRGSEHGNAVEKQRLISCVSRCLNPYEPEDHDALLELAASDDLEYIISNTTEAGIAYDPACAFSDRPSASFPGKLTQFLYERFRAGKPGLVILACELIDDNGGELLRCVNAYIKQWQLPEAFSRYVNEACTFCGSLVDRIVPGKVRDPKEKQRLEAQLGYRDELLDVGELFGLWVIEGDPSLGDRLPFQKAGLSGEIFVTPDVRPYKQRKVRILNGAHTGMVPGAYLAGKTIVRDCMEDADILSFLERMLEEEILPHLPMDRAELVSFAAAVKDRFCNPYVDHALLSIALNSVSKWRARNLPSLLAYAEAEKKLPPLLVRSLAMLLAFYTSRLADLTEEGLSAARVTEAGQREAYLIRDERWILEFFWMRREADPALLVRDVLASEAMWGQDLTQVPGLTEAVTEALTIARKEGTRALMRL